MKLIKNISYLLIPVFLILSGSIFSQKSYYISPSGNDQNNGSFGAPWANIQFGIDEIEKGDTLYVLQGVYNQLLNISKSGEADKELIISAYPGIEVILDYRVLESGRAGVIIEDQKYIKFKGFKMLGGGHAEGPAAIEIKNSSNISIENNKISWFKFGIFAYNSSSNEIVQALVIKNNFISHSFRQGLCLGPLDINGDSGVISEIQVSNNSLFENDLSLSGIGEYVISYSDNTEVFNNVFYTNEQAISGSVYEFFFNVNFDFNAYYSLAGKDEWVKNMNGQEFKGFDYYREKSGRDQNSIFVYPQFLDLSENNTDLHLTPNSPLVDTGNREYNPGMDERDIDGQHRINKFIDIGADEYYLKLIICALGAFDAELINNRVQLTWSGTCFSENGGSYYILRSKDGENWSKIGEQNSQLEKLNTEVFYKYWDEQPGEGINYYKVRFIDDNGSFNDSNPDVVEYSKNEVLLYPNPVYKWLNVISKQDGLKFFTVINYNGKMLKAGEVNDKKIDLQSLNQGIYLLLLENEDGSKSYKQLFWKI